MAHQAHNLPWNTLAANFKYQSNNPCYQWKTNIYPLHKPGQAKQLTYFANAFEQTIEAFSASERAKYPTAEEYHPHTNESIHARDDQSEYMPAATVRRIERTLRKFRRARHAKLTQWGPWQNPPVSYLTTGYGDSSPIALSDECRRMSFWARSHDDCDPRLMCNLLDHQDAAELLKMLLLLNEMDVLLRVTLRPGNAKPVVAWWTFPYECPDYGWAELMRTALMAYICLNVMYVLEERKVVEISSDKDKENHTDYRRTAAYQMMICRVTATRTYDVHTYPHRGFFGVTEAMYGTNDWRENPLYGRESLAKLRQRSSASIHVPSTADFYTALHYLNIKGLPTELGMMVLEFAKYEPHHTAIVPDDPLHVENAAELRKYLGFCWQLLVRCDVLAKACGKCVDWVGEVTQCIFHLFGVKYPTMVKIGIDHGFDDEFRNWKGNEIEECWIKFV